MRRRTNIGRRMAELRLTERGLADLLGVEQSYVNKVKNGKVQPLVGQALRFASVLGWSVEALWDMAPGPERKG